MGETINVKNCSECDNVAVIKKLADRINEHELQTMKVLVGIESYQAENRKLRKLYSDLLGSKEVVKHIN